MQDAIWKTFQSRIEARLLQIENCLLIESGEKEYQFYRLYQKNRSGVVGLMGAIFATGNKTEHCFSEYILLVLLLAKMIFF
jgi:hypothetical protein